MRSTGELLTASLYTNLWFRPLGGMCCWEGKGDDKGCLGPGKILTNHELPITNHRRSRPRKCWKLPESLRKSKVLPWSEFENWQSQLTIFGGLPQQDVIANAGRPWWTESKLGPTWLDSYFILAVVWSDRGILCSREILYMRRTKPSLYET